MAPETSLLINLSNHSSTNWSDEQKFGFHIIDLPFPNIDPNADVSDVKKTVKEYEERIWGAIREVEDSNSHPEHYVKVHIMLQGEYTFCYLLLDTIRHTEWLMAIPTTERVVEEKVVDGKVMKTSVFKFVRWRIFKP